MLSTFRMLRGDALAPSDPFGPAPGTERDVAALISRLRLLHGIRDTSQHTLPRWMDLGDEFEFSNVAVDLSADGRAIDERLATDRGRRPQPWRARS
ncbi:MAG: hypothetical protein IPK16_05025 [Anaerolineales bacterium]|nr:hypothetical protein [Anaerolineales bacterium]